MQAAQDRCVMGRACGTCGREKTPLRTCRHKLEDNIKIYLAEIGLEGVNWINLAQNRYKCAVVEMVTNLWVL